MAEQLEAAREQKEGELAGLLGGVTSALRSWTPFIFMLRGTTSPRSSNLR